MSAEGGLRVERAFAMIREVVEDGNFQGGAARQELAEIAAIVKVDLTDADIRTDIWAPGNLRRVTEGVRRLRNAAVDAGVTW